MSARFNRAMTAVARAFSTPLSSHSGREIAVLIERRDRRAFLFAGKEFVELRAEKIAQLFRDGTIRRIECCQGIDWSGLLGRIRRSGGKVSGCRRGLVRRYCGREAGQHGCPLGKRRCHGRGREFVGILRHTAKRRDKNQRERGGRQNAMTHRTSPQVDRTGFHGSEGERRL